MYDRLLRESVTSAPVQTETVMYISDLSDRDDLELVTDSSDAESLRIEYDLTGFEAYDSFFVAVDDGEYTEVWGFFGIIPRLDKRVYRVH